MLKTKLAERVIKLCPDLMGMARTSEQLLSDPRTAEALVNLVEQLTDELVNTEQLAKDRYCKMQSEIERLREETACMEQTLLLNRKHIAKARDRGMSDLAGDNEFIYTKRANREDCRPAWKYPPPHTVMDRWVRCHVVGDKVVLGPAVSLSSTHRALLERQTEAEIHEKRERPPTFFDIYAEQSARITHLEQVIRQLLRSHKDGFQGCCWCGVGVGDTHTPDCENRRAFQAITDHDEQESP